MKGIQTGTRSFRLESLWRAFKLCIKYKKCTEKNQDCVKSALSWYDLG